MLAHVIGSLASVISPGEAILKNLFLSVYPHLFRESRAASHLNQFQVENLQRINANGRGLHQKLSYEISGVWRGVDR